MSTRQIDISGKWECEINIEDEGMKSFKVKLPGTTAENRIGKRLEIKPELSKEAVRCLRQEHSYIGRASYSRTIEIPEEWKDKRIHLFLERVMFQSRVSIDGKEIGVQDSLSTPHIYDITDSVTVGCTHSLNIVIDNSDVERIGPNPSAYTDETQTIWNGIVGRINLEARDKAYIQDVQIYPNIHTNSVKLVLTCLNYYEKPLNADFCIEARGKNFTAEELINTHIYNHELMVGVSNIELEYDMGRDFQLWDEFSPSLYELKIEFKAEAGENKFSDVKTIAFGMKEFKADGTQFAINGRKTFLRGTLDCCIFPETGYPPMDTASWNKIFSTVKSYGLNHVRFHSWCPPEEAFVAADNAGIYLNVEGPMWMDTWNGCLVGQHPEHYEYLPGEAARIISAYRNHPSFCMFSNGNELNGDFNLLSSIIEKLKKHDSGLIYTLTTNWDRPLNSNDDYFASQSVDGVGVRGQYYLDKMVEGTTLDFNNAVGLRNVPIISHEVGQYCVYPDMEEISRYRGVLRPVNFEAIRNDLMNKNMYKDSKCFKEGSGKLALQLYKDEIEAALRTSGFGGFQLLDIHDFPGQSTATIGILNSFWESKGLITPEEFRSFCSETVPLLRMAKRIYRNDENFSGEVEVAHFGPDIIEKASVNWSIRDAKGAIIAEGSYKNIDIPIGNGIKIGGITGISLNNITRASQLTVTVEIEGTGSINTWNIWVYPEVKEKFEICIAEKFDSRVEELLVEGKDVLLIPEASEFREANGGRFFPVFWSPVHFISKDPCGIYCDSKHPVFRDFPTEFYSSYQWKNLLENSVSVVLDDLPGDFEPIVKVIPNFYNNRRLGNILEARVGKGRLILCSIDIRNKPEMSLEAAQLRYSILSYMSGTEFEPKYSLKILEIKKLFKDEASELNGADSRINIALQKKAWADSEKSSSYSASRGNDGNPNSCWCAADANTGHYWQVDLGDIYNISGTKISFNEDANYLYVIQVSIGGEEWKVAANKTGQTGKCTEMEDTFTERARYVRIIYNGLQAGIYAGHSAFEVYGEKGE